MVTFNEVSKNYGSINALRDVSFTIEKGEFVFIIGPSGAGKTTLLKLLIGQIRPSSGELFVDDIPLHKLRRSQVPYLRQQIGVVYQDFKLLPERTVRENVEVPLAVKNIPQKEWRSRVDQVLKLVGLSARSELFPAQLSGGELQRASLARALVVNPQLILADEPTGNLDWKTADAIVDLLVKINAEGKTLIVTSHNKAIIEKLGKRVIELEDGKVVKDSKHKR